jgi:serine/threonine-protein kinase RsbW
MDPVTPRVPTDSDQRSPGTDQAPPVTSAVSSGVESASSEVGLPWPVVLQLPAQAGFIRLARLLASGIATRLGLPVEGVQDLRVAVDEGCATLVEVAHDGTMTIEFGIVDDALVVSGEARAASGKSLDEGRLRVSRQILEVITDDHEVRHVNGTIRFRLVRGLDVPGGN